MIKMLKVSYFDRVFVFDQFLRARVQEFVLMGHQKDPRATQWESGSPGSFALKPDGTICFRAKK